MKKCVLIVEDDADILDILQISLDRPDLKIITYTKLPTQQEVSLLSPDLVIMDIRIFGSPKTGDQLCVELKSSRDTCHIPVILLSAEYRLAEISIQCQADSYITKPFDIIKLSNTIFKYLDAIGQTSIDTTPAES